MTKLQNLQKFLSTHMPLIEWFYDVPTQDDKFYGNQEDWNRTLVTKINQTSATIFKDTLKGGANAILISSDVEEEGRVKIEEVMKSLGDFFHVDLIPNEGYYKLGVLGGRFNIYVVPNLTEENKIFVCKLTDVNKPMSVKNYIRVGVVKVHKIFKMFD